jgi:hypothetical protein
MMKNRAMRYKVEMDQSRWVRNLGFPEKQSALLKEIEKRLHSRKANINIISQRLLGHKNSSTRRNKRLLTNKYLNLKARRQLNNLSEGIT